MRTITNKQLQAARQLAETNYSDWGQWVVECMTDDELRISLADEKTLASWVNLRKQIASVYQEIENTAF